MLPFHLYNRGLRAIGILVSKCSGSFNTHTYTPSIHRVGANPLQNIMNHLAHVYVYGDGQQGYSQVGVHKSEVTKLYN